MPRGMASRLSYARPVINQSFNKISVPGGVLSTKQDAKLIYAEPGIVLNSTSGICGVRVFQLNSLFDPDLTGVGHQPVGYDQLMALYEEYLVKAVRYKITCQSTSDNNEIIVGVSINDNSTTQQDPRVYMENGMTNWQVISRIGSGNNTKDFSGYIDLSKVHGVSYKEYLAETAYKGSQFANPTEGAFLHVWIVAANQSASVGAVAHVELTYSSEFSGGKFTALS